MAVEDISLPVGDSRLAAMLHRPSGQPRAGAVISHGLQSSMQSQKLTSLAGALCTAGVLVLRFDHLGCGMSPGREEDTTLTGRRDEFLAAVEMLRPMVKDLPLAYLGSSFGGTVAFCAGDILPPACSVVWSAPTDLEELFLRMRSAPEVPRLGALARDITGFDLRAILARASRVLFVHGQKDEVVPVAQARRGHEFSRQPKELLVLPGADHRLSKAADQATATKATLAWVGRFCWQQEQTNG